MFATFSSSSNDGAGPRAPDNSSVRLHRKRHQVARACLSCRTYRIKCDANYPCRNCQSKGRKCTAEAGKGDVRTFPHALKEIERLKKKIDELEERCRSSRDVDVLNKDHNASLASSTSSVSLPVNLDPLGQHGGNKRYYNWDLVSGSKTGSSSQMYGPSSSLYFLSQMATYLDADFQHHPYPRSSTTKKPVQRTSSMEYPGLLRSSASPELSRACEESLLLQYWAVYHPIHPILNESEFHAHYESLWKIESMHRQPSALIDMMLALSMQCQATSPIAQCAARRVSIESNGTDVPMQGHFWHRRGHTSLLEELEEPSMRTFQCHLLSVRWLANAGFQNMAHSVTATGIRIGIILGLHLEPSRDLPPIQQDFRKRLWWILYATDMKFAMELGRPLAVHFSNVTCTIPDDELGVTLNSSATFIAQFVKLILATRAIYITFYGRCGKVLSQGAVESLYQDPAALEECANFLASRTKYLDAWVQQVPDTMRCNRKGSDKSFTAKSSELNLQVIGNPEITRQSVILELLYHNLVMSLYRPFIAFTNSKNFDKPKIKEHALSCANHAITITSLIHQLLTETTYLNDGVETFQWQWTAAISLVGYIIAHPLEAVAQMARNTLETALVVLDILSERVSGAVAARAILRELVCKADLFIAHAEQPTVRDGITSLFSVPSETVAQALDTNYSNFDSGHAVDLGLPEPLDDGGLGAWRDALASAPGFHFTPDSFNGLEEFSTDTGLLFDFLDPKAFEE